MKEKTLARRIRKALDGVIDECKARGVKNPVLYFETEGLVVLDGDHPYYHSESASLRQQAIVMHLDGAYPPRTDMGAW